MTWSLSGTRIPKEEEEKELSGRILQHSDRYTTGNSIYKQLVQNTISRFKLFTDIIVHFLLQVKQPLTPMV